MAATPVAPLSTGLPASQAVAVLAILVLGGALLVRPELFAFDVAETADGSLPEPWDTRLLRVVGAVAVLVAGFLWWLLATQV